MWLKRERFEVFSEGSKWHELGIIGKALWLPCWLNKKVPSLPSKNLRTSCCCWMKLYTCEGIWLPSTWPKSPQVFSVAIPFLVSTSKLRLLSVFYNITSSFQSCKSCYYGLIQVNVNIKMRQGLRYSVNSHAHVYVCSRESILSLTLDSIEILQNWSFLFYPKPFTNGIALDL